MATELELAVRIFKEMEELETTEVAVFSNKTDLLNEELTTLNRNISSKLEILKPYVEFLKSSDEVLSPSTRESYSLGVICQGLPSIGEGGWSQWKPAVGGATDQSRCLSFSHSYFLPPSLLVTHIKLDRGTQVDHTCVGGMEPDGPMLFRT